MQSSIPEPVFLNVEYLFFLVFRAVGAFFRHVFTIEFLEQLRVIATILVILLITLIIYILIRLYELKQEDEEKAKKLALQQSSTTYPRASSVNSGSMHEAVVATRNQVWEEIRAKLLSDNQSDWRLAIIEADIYMDRLLDDRGFHGDTTSDKLKKITPAELASIQIAWEAHKVRNRIAHDGASFALTQPEARRTLSYFEIVFRDLGAIN